MQRFRGMNRDCVLRNPEITRAVWHGRWNWIAPGGQSRALPLEFNHTCLPACDIIVMRVRALYTPFRAKCTVQSVDEASGRSAGWNDACGDVAPYVRPHVDFPWHCVSCNVRLYLAMCVSRVSACCRRRWWFHSRARMRRYALYYTLAIWGIQFVARIVTVDARLVVLFIFKTRRHVIQSYYTTFVVPQAKRRFYVLAFRFEQLILVTDKLHWK